MVTTFHLPADELNLSVLESIKEAFRGKNIEIIFSDVDEPAKEAALLRRINNLREDKNTVTFSQEDFFKTYSKKIAS